YFTSRPFYKEMSRSLQHYLRTADLLFSFALQTSTATKKDFPSLNLYDKLVDARRELSVFQHHDGVTGTAKDDVMKDYGDRMLRSLSDTQQVIEQSSHFLLNVSGNDLRALRSDEVFFIDKVPEKAVVKPGSTIVLFNSLARQREEVVCVHVTAAQVAVQSVNADGQKEEIDQQIAPVITLKDDKIASEKDKYELCFMASIPAMGFRKYSLVETPELDRDVLVDIFTEGDVEIEHSKVAKIDKDPEVSNSFLTANFDGKTGLLKSIKTSGVRDQQQVKLSFVKYGARPQGTLKGPLTSSDSMSGAYLFLPDGPANPFTSSKNAYVVVKGPVRSSVVAKGPSKAHLLHRVHLDANGRSLRIQNEFDIRGLADSEVAMRFDTVDAKEQEKGVKEDKKATKAGEMSDFFSDLNGYQMIRRRRFEKLPIQAHFFPMPSAAYIESPTRRLSLYSQQPGGVASLTPGQLEVMLDRRLDHDDNRGLDQPVHDNRPTKADFRLFLEDLEAPSKPADKHAPTTGFHTLAGNREQLKLQYPVVTLHTEGLSAKDTEGSPNELSLLSQPLPCDVHMLALRTTTAETTYENAGAETSSRKSTPEKAAAMILHRFGVDCRATQSVEGCSMAGSKVQLRGLFREKPKSIKPSSLSLLYVEQSSVDSLPIEPMEIKTVKVNF
ncbi:glycosyl hydrolase family 38 protein, partial [Aphelenchoides avenae]